MVNGLNLMVFFVLMVKRLKNKASALKIKTNLYKNKEERFSRVPRLSDTRYSAKGTKGKWRYASSKARLKCATYPRSLLCGR